jgi:hypothetical protein
MFRALQPSEAPGSRGGGLAWLLLFPCPGLVLGDLAVAHLDAGVARHDFLGECARLQPGVRLDCGPDDFRLGHGRALQVMCSATSLRRAGSGGEGRGFWARWVGL